MKKLTVVNLFAGAGGLSNGFEQAGLKCILGVDFDETAMKTFKRNHPHAKTFICDIAELTNEKATKCFN